MFQEYSKLPAEDSWPLGELCLRDRAMATFDDWCEIGEQEVNGHSLCMLDGKDLPLGRDSLAERVVGHYASADRIAGILKRLGKTAAAKYLTNKLPQGSRIRSGDLGEIVGAEYIVERMDYEVPIKRLRWKDHRNMALRGDDAIGIRRTDEDRLEFLKSEIKSRKKAAQAVVAEARKALNKNNGRPSPHALTYVADHLRHTDVELADLIDDAQLKHGITADDVEHLLLMFSGNSAATFLKKDLDGYKGKIAQNSVAIKIASHQEFVREVFDKVIADA